MEAVTWSPLHPQTDNVFGGCERFEVATVPMDGSHSRTSHADSLPLRYNLPHLMDAYGVGAALDCNR
jgi:hypothetical protein